jgi:hypothetical protein
VGCCALLAIGDRRYGRGGVDERAYGDFKVSKSIEDRVIDWISRHGNKGTAPRDLVAARIVADAKYAKEALNALAVDSRGAWKNRKFYLLDSQVRVGTNLDTQDPRFRSDLLRLLRKPITIKALASKLHVHSSDVEHALDDLEQSGYVVERTGQRITLGSVVPESDRRIIRENHFIDKLIKFGVVADMHMCSKSGTIGMSCMRMESPTSVNMPSTTGHSARASKLISLTENAMRVGGWDEKESNLVAISCWRRNGKAATTLYTLGR